MPAQAMRARLPIPVGLLSDRMCVRKGVMVELERRPCHIRRKAEANLRKTPACRPAEPRQTLLIGRGGGGYRENTGGPGAPAVPQPTQSRSEPAQNASM